MRSFRTAKMTALQRKQMDRKSRAINLKRKVTKKMDSDVVNHQIKYLSSKTMMKYCFLLLFIPCTLYGSRKIRSEVEIPQFQQYPIEHQRKHQNHFAVNKIEEEVSLFADNTANHSQLQQLQLLRDIRSSYLPSSAAAASSSSLSSFDFKSWSRKNDTSYLFLHVGKAAGSTIYCKLTLPRIDETRFKQKFWCKGKVKKERAKTEIPLYSQKFDSRLHMREVEKEDGSHEVFLVSLRNPITRFVSAYEYEKSKQNQWVQKSYPIFKRCFPNEVSAQSFLLNLEGEGGMSMIDESSNSSIMSHTNRIMNTSSYCREVAMNVAKGLVSSYRSHMTYNYQFYENEFLAAPASAAAATTNANVNNSTSSINNKNGNKNKNNRKHLVAVRSEYLEQDFKYFEMLLRNGVVVDEEDNTTTTTISDTTIAMNVNKKRKSANGSSSSIISPDAGIVLCRVLCEDIQAYKRLLFRAENLNEEMVYDSIRDLQKHCPTETLQVREREQCSEKEDFFQGKDLKK